MAKVAFLGLGVMGYPMAGHLSQNGHEVNVYNRTISKSEKWVNEYNGNFFNTPLKAAEGVDQSPSIRSSRQHCGRSGANTFTPSGWTSCSSAPGHLLSGAGG